MYRDKILSVFYQIKDNTYILHYEDKTKELMILNSYFIKIGKISYSIEDIIKSQKHLYKEEFNLSENKIAINFKNLSKKKMEIYKAINISGFSTNYFYKKFINFEKDIICLAFDIKCKNKDFKMLMIIKKDKIKFIPIFCENKKNRIFIIEKSKTFQTIKQYMEKNIDKTSTKKFNKLINKVEYLTLSSYYSFKF